MTHKISLGHGSSTRARPAGRPVTIDDPGAHSRPFRVTYQATLIQPGDELMEYVCQENNQYGVASGVR